jgi:hypothetical protein
MRQKRVRFRVVATYFGDHESFNLAGVRNMGTNTQIDHGAAAINCSRGTIRNFRLDKVLLVFIVLCCRYGQAWKEMGPKNLR